jgi:hypothetical protein
MESLRWVDSTYAQKHKSDNPKDLRAMYYPNLAMYSTKTKTKVRTGPSKPLSQGVVDFSKRYARRVSMWFVIYIISLLPFAGRFVMPATSFVTFRKAVGMAPATVIFGSSLFLPKEVLVMFLHTYFASRSLMRELVSGPSFLCTLECHFDIPSLAPTLFPPHPIYRGPEAPVVP